ncbi:MAG: cyclase family protein [Acidimicrobiia bacterium]|nr:cyclase family protein [Acidimicrobiia bacterium]
MGLSAAFHELAAEVRNWGRWGDHDPIGTLNLLTDETVKAAATSIETGERISLAMPLHHDGPQLGAIPGRVNPLHAMVSINTPSLGDPDGFCTNDDVVTMGLQAATHWDGLGHVSYGGRLYNGVRAATVTAEGGVTTLGIENVRSLTGRGVLLDIAGLLDVDVVAGDTIITGAMLDDAAAAGAVDVRRGDIVIIRTAWTRHLDAGDKPAYAGWTQGSPGPGFDAVRWFHRHELAAVATDTYVFEAFPGEDPDAMLGVHLADIVDMGLTQGQNWLLDDLAAACAVDGRYDFFLEASPQPVVGGAGSPVNPVAIR